MLLPKPSSPRAAWRDLSAFFRNAGPRQYGLMVLSAAIPLVILAALTYDTIRPEKAEYDLMVFGDIIPANPDDPMYVDWQKRKMDDFNRRRDNQAKAEKAKQESFKRLADEWGIETD
jgi:hypothetical protein